MDGADTARVLWSSLPFLLGGFALNLWVAAVAMAIGTAFGAGLALLRLSPRRPWQRLGNGITLLARGVPTIVLQFYLVMLLPPQVALGGMVLVLPTWLKAALALAWAVGGYCSDSLHEVIGAWRRGERAPALLFVPGWTSYALIIVMASTTAALVGVPEMLSRCNTLVNASGSSALVLPLYACASAVFFGVCFPLTVAMRRLSRHLAARLDAPAGR